MASDEDLRLLRRALHERAELSGHEEGTAAFVQNVLRQKWPPDEWLTGLGGHGLAAIYRGASPGPTVMIRAELDALPIPETCSLDHGSKRDGVAHKCGHDGHMAILMGVGARLHETPPPCGAVVLLFQPAEETGAGAQLVLQDARFAALPIAYTFALHNLPGYPLGSILARSGVFASASQVLITDFHGETSHAAEPQCGISPAPAVADMIHGLGGLGQRCSALHEAVQATVVHARVGAEAYGTSPGAGRVVATVRTHDDRLMNDLVQHCGQLAAGVAQAYGLGHDVQWVEAFPTTTNDDDCVQLVKAAADQLQLKLVEPEVPFPWSEDFGWFTAACPGALFGLGAGDNCPALHSGAYDFPDDLIAVGVSVFTSLIEACLVEAS